MSRPDSERGAISIIVLGLMVASVGLAAFSADIALGYAEKRQQSIAADAATLASARAVSEAIPVGGSCDEAALEGLTTVQSAASTINSANDLDGRSALSAPVDVDCSGSNGIEVTVRNSETVPTTLLSSRLLGVATSLEPPGAATSLLFVPTQGEISGLRPIAACQDRLVKSIENSALNGDPETGEPLLVEIDKSTGACGSASSGNWGYVDFLDQGSFSSTGNQSGGNKPNQEEWIRDGYQGLFYYPNPDLGANTGLVKATNDELADLAGQEILLPVVTQFSGSGKKGQFNTTGVMAAYVCAVKNPPGKDGGVHVEMNSDPRCTPYPRPDSPGASGLPTAPESDPDYSDTWVNMPSTTALLWVVPSRFLQSGSPLDPSSGCTPGPGCPDFGVLATQLWK